MKIKHLTLQPFAPPQISMFTSNTDTPPPDEVCLALFWYYFCLFVCFRAGVVTSLLSAEDGEQRQGLAYIRTQAGGVGLKVRSY